MGKRHSARRRTGMAVLLGAAAMALPVVAAAPTSAADIISSEGSVTVESYPSVKQLLLERFDDQGGRLQLTRVTVTGTVESELDGSVTNLSTSREKTLTGVIATGIEVDGPGVEDLTAEGSRTTSWTLAAGETRQVQLAASGSSVETITDPQLLDDFVGSGSLELRRRRPGQRRDRRSRAVPDHRGRGRKGDGPHRLHLRGGVRREPHDRLLR